MSLLEKGASKTILQRTNKKLESGDQKDFPGNPQSIASRPIQSYNGIPRKKVLLAKGHFKLCTASERTGHQQQQQHYLPHLKFTEEEQQKKKQDNRK